MAESMGEDPTMQAEIVGKLLPSRRTYRPDPVWRAMMLMIVGLPTLASLISPIRLLATGQASFQIDCILSNAVILLPLVLWVYVLSHTSLVTSPEGVELHIAGSAMLAKWDNIKNIKDAHLKEPFIMGGSLALYQPALRTKGWLFWPTIMRRVIPLTPFIGLSNSPELEGELERDFRQYAPHLFAEE
jgi:hypothetical protein